MFGGEGLAVTKYLSFGGYSSALHVRILIGRFKDVISVAPSRCSRYLFMSKYGVVLPHIQFRVSSKCLVVKLLYYITYPTVHWPQLSTLVIKFLRGSSLDLTHM